MKDEEVPEADRAEELDEDEEERGPAPPVDNPEVPEADAAEQAQPLRRSANERPRIREDVPEADALEQARAAFDEDEDDYR